MGWTVTVEISLVRIVTVIEKTKWAICQRLRGGFSVSVEEPRGQIINGIECGRVTAGSRGQ